MQTKYNEKCKILMLLKLKKVLVILNQSQISDLNHLHGGTT